MHTRRMTTDDTEITEHLILQNSMSFHYELNQSPTKQNKKCTTTSNKLIEIATSKCPFIPHITNRKPQTVKLLELPLSSLICSPSIISNQLL